LHLQTKLSNPHYPPEIQAETTLINFMVTEDGLEDQLLSTVVALERPDLAQQQVDLIAQQNGFKIKMTELEDGILEQLANAEGDVTENIALIENLEDSKATSIEIGEKMIVAKQTEVIIDKAREEYRPVANRGSLLFFLLSDLFKVHTFHFYSLSSFEAVLTRAIAGRKGPGDLWNEDAAEAKVFPGMKNAAIKAAIEAAKDPDEPEPKADPKKLQERLQYLVENVTFEVFNFTRRGLFDAHKLIVATMLVLRVMQRRNEAAADEVDYLVMGRQASTPPVMTAKVQEYLTPIQWAAANALKEIDFFKQVISALAACPPSPSLSYSLCLSRIILSPSFFSSFCLLSQFTEDLELNVEGWRDWVEHPSPEGEELPGDWQKKTSSFLKLLIVRALRTDRVTAALTAFIIEYMGERYMVQPPFSMEGTFEDSSSATPLFFVLFPGVDPGEAIEALGNKLGFTEVNGNFVSISMGQGQEKNGENVLDRYTREGGWAFLQNVHLMQGWLPMLERKLEIAQEIAHEDFRCFVTAEPPGMPSQMLIPEGSTLSLARIEHRMRVGWEVDWVGGLGVGLERGGRHEPALPCRCCLP
jgi:dynein heavy chain